MLQQNQVSKSTESQIVQWQNMDATHTASLGIPELSESASVAHVFSDMANNYVRSVCQLCNEGYYVTFRTDGVAIYNSASNAIFKGKHNLGARLWCINLHSDKHQIKIAEANNIYELCNSGALAQPQQHSYELSRKVISQLGQG
jgi:hypothetical protein